jgi:hypothetical protein
MKMSAAKTLGISASLLAILAVAPVGVARQSDGQPPPAPPGPGQQGAGQAGAGPGGEGRQGGGGRQGQPAGPPRPSPFADVKFRSYIIDDALPGGSISQTSLYDVDGDGKLEIHIGTSAGNFIYKMESLGRWSRHQVVQGRAPTDAGGLLTDVDGDKDGDIVAGSAWYRNPGNLNTAWQRFDYDPQNAAVHDQLMVDVDKDGRLDMVTMSDRNNLRWYTIPRDPTQPWVRHDIGPALHGGIAPHGFGDIAGKGFVDFARVDVWFENVKGDGTEWRQHALGPFPDLPAGEPAWADNSARAWVADINADGRNDVVQSVEEYRPAQIWWMENLGPGAKGVIQWKRHYIAGLDRVMGGLHSLGVADFTGDGKLDVYTSEYEWNRARPGPNGEENPRYFLYENLGVGPAWDGPDATVRFKEHVIADLNLGGHEDAIADLNGDGKIDIVSKPWSASPRNALGGRAFVLILENLSTPPQKMPAPAPPVK